MKSRSRRVSCSPAPALAPSRTPRPAHDHPDMHCPRLAQVRAAFRGAPRLPVRRATSMIAAPGRAGDRFQPRRFARLDPPQQSTPPFALACRTFDAPAPALLVNRRRPDPLCPVLLLPPPVAPRQLRTAQNSWGTAENSSGTAREQLSKSRTATKSSKPSSGTARYSSGTAPKGEGSY